VIAVRKTVRKALPFTQQFVFPSPSGRGPLASK
jgi:hypothetical protein